VTEDEAFIRAIVDGDSTARGAYADWLDDRDDLRGPYLRAEAAWGKKPTQAAQKKAQKLAKSLDAVWLARVSRPPLGTCCRHVRFDSATATTAASVDQYEQVIGVTLPPDYRAFLLNYNGGVPKPNCFPVPNGRRGRLESIQVFFPLTDRADVVEDPTPNNLGDAHDWLYSSPLAVLFPHERRPFIPVAWFGEVSGDEESVAGVQYGRRVLLGIRGPRRGEVHMITRDSFAQGDKTRLLAASFSEFLATLQAPTK
jgi:uncharacterized protein (TIGR02996 family)